MKLLSTAVFSRCVPLFKWAIACALFLTGTSVLSDSVIDQHQTGTKYSPLSQITRDNVQDLSLAWEYHTGEVPGKLTPSEFMAFEDQPSLIEGNLLVCSPSRRIIALDPKTGEERWAYDPKDPDMRMKKCRGIASWVDQTAKEETHCRTRLLMGTADYRLVAIDAKDGKPCERFGDAGEVRMPTSIAEVFPGEVQATSRPAVVNDVVVVGSVVADNQRVEAPSGRVLAYNAKTGEPLWEFDPVPRDPTDPASATWESGSGKGFGGGNVWAAMSVDHDLDLVYLPTTSSSSDFYGGDREGDNLYTSSVVALRGSTGEVAWHFQTVHHNVFDYDIPSQPLLIDFPYQGDMVPALVQNTKMGMIFVFNRANGEPLIPIEERPVPQAGKVAGEVLSPTQPFPVGMPVLADHNFSPEKAWGFTFLDKWLCKRKIEKLNYGPIYTPPSEQGTVMSPSMGGGPNWGGGAYDPNHNIMVVPSNRVPMVLTLLRAENTQLTEDMRVEGLGAMTFNVKGSKYLPKTDPLMSFLGAPCSEPPWAALSAVEMSTGKLLWDKPLGNLDNMLPSFMAGSMNFGLPGAGGPLITAGGLVFIGYAIDDQFRAYDLQTGEVVWSVSVPAAATSIPISYEVDGEQYIVVPAGGHSMYQSTMGDSVMAYKLKRR